MRLNRFGGTTVDAHNGDWAGRWINNGTMEIDATADRASFTSSEFQQDSPALLRGVRLNRFEATFSLRRNVTSANTCSLRFIFNADDQDGYNYVELFHHDTAQAPDGYKVVDGTKRLAATGTQTVGNMPSLGQNDVLWVRVFSDGTNLKVMMQQSATEPGSWTEGSHKVYQSANFTLSGGLIGFAGGADAMLLDDLTAKADRDNNGSYEVTEHWEGFTLDGSGYADETPVYDACGNLTYDGVYRYTYDGWNRLAKVTKGIPQLRRNAAERV